VQGEAAERFVVFALRVLAVSFAVVGLLYLFVPTPTLDVISDVGEIVGFNTRDPAHAGVSCGSRSASPTWR